MFTTYNFSSSLANALSLSLSGSPAVPSGRNYKSRTVAEDERGQEGRRSGGLVEVRQGRL